MKCIPAKVFNKLTIEEKHALFSYFNLIGKHVTNMVSTYTDPIPNIWAVKVEEYRVCFAPSTNYTDFYNYSEIQNMISLSLT